MMFRARKDRTLCRSVANFRHTHLGDDGWRWLTWGRVDICEWWRRMPDHSSTMTSCWWRWRHDILHTGAYTTAAALSPWQPSTRSHSPVHIMRSIKRYQCSQSRQLVLAMRTTVCIENVACMHIFGNGKLAIFRPFCLSPRAVRQNLQQHE